MGLRRPLAIDALARDRCRHRRRPPRRRGGLDRRARDRRLDRDPHDDVLVPTVRRFSRVAAISVATLVTTGLVQSVRLIGSPMDLLDASHGRYLLAKIVVLALMLAIANANRRRIDHRLDDHDEVGRHTGPLRQAVVAEFAIGLVIIGITAAMVVSPPSTSRTETGAPRDARVTSILHDVVLTPERLTR